MNEDTVEEQAHSQQDAPQGDEPCPGARIFTGQLFRVREGHGWGFTDEAPEPPPAPVYRPSRVAQMLALAHRLEAAIERGDYRDRADLARQLGFTRARVTQLLNLTLLAPDIQEAVLALEAVDGVQPTSERALRDVVGAVAWAEQRERWRTALSVGAGG